jgi:hypothetical protein
VAEITNRRHEEQTKADLQRRIIESFSKAVALLASEKIEARLGGIYTLERIARESRNDYWPVMETLCAFVRERALCKESDASAKDTVFIAEAEKKSHPNERRIPELPTDVAAVLSVIKRRPQAEQDRERQQKWWIDLHGADLRRAHLRCAS